MAEKIYKEDRFEFAFFENENLICKRNFRINGYIDGSMQTADFKDVMDGIVAAIDNDLKSKSRVYTWVYGDNSQTYQELPQELTSPLIDPWTCVFKFVVYDNHVPVIERIWDGRYYPKMVRDRVDITNKTVKITNHDGATFSFDKESFFRDNQFLDLSPETYCIRAMIMDKPDLLYWITKTICKACSPSEEGYATIKDYVDSETFHNDKITKKNNSKADIAAKSRKYTYNIKKYNKRIDSIWGKAVAEKTKAYFASLD